jgi:hypothetical protein
MAQLDENKLHEFVGKIRSIELLVDPKHLPELL